MGESTEDIVGDDMSEFEVIVMEPVITRVGGFTDCTRLTKKITIGATSGANPAV